MGVLVGLPSGYNKDYQETKKPFMEAVELALQALGVVELTVRNLEPNEERLLAACTPELYATDRAYELVQAGTPFRDAYRRVGASLDALPAVDARASLSRRTHIGASGNLGIGPLRAAIAEREREAAEELQRLQAHWQRMLIEQGGER